MSAPQRSPVFLSNCTVVSASISVLCPAAASQSMSRKAITLALPGTSPSTTLVLPSRAFSSTAPQLTDPRFCTRMPGVPAPQGACCHAPNAASSRSEVSW
ncbi:hypothetical protein [Sorangium sp. So ce1389]|uniref:hypothetical protein n=1 Tax=Sorangium sp. So ce1389 TaxID=3133336 RepID=UPI003F6481AF